MKLFPSDLIMMKRELAEDVYYIMGEMGYHLLRNVFCKK